EGRRDPLARIGGRAAHGLARAGARAPGEAEGAPAPRAGGGAVARARRGSGHLQADRGAERKGRAVRDGRRDEREPAQGRRSGEDRAGAGGRAPRRPPRPRRLEAEEAFIANRNTVLNWPKSDLNTPQTFF